MEHFHERRAGLVLLVALTFCLSVPASATAVLESTAPSPSSYLAATNANQLLSPSPTDYGWHGDLLVATEGMSLSSGNELISFGTMLSEQNSDTDEVIRHRNFTKALLIILILGGLIRFFTSPTYVKFISDALDPKAF